MVGIAEESAIDRWFGPVRTIEVVVHFNQGRKNNDWNKLMFAFPKTRKL
jgi:hypothetical protein